jgi:HK97 family phage major capsid protein
MFVQLLKEWKGKAAGETIQVPEEYGPLLIEQKIAAAVAHDPLNGLLTKAMEDVTSKWAQSMDQVIHLALKKFQEIQSQARKHSVPAIFGEGGDGDPKKNFGDWLVKVATATIGKPRQAAEAAAALEKDYGSSFNPWQKAALAESSGVAGGYIVPPQFYDQLLAIAAEQTTFRNYAFVQPMASATLQFPFLDITTVQAAGTSPFFGGVKANWTAEAQTRTETEPQFKMMELKAHELSGYSVSSNVLLQDAVFGLEKFLMVLFGNAVGWYEEYAFLQGNGVGKPLGVINANAAINVTRNQTGHFTFADISSMLANLLPASYSRAHWYCSPTVVADLLQLKDGSNRAIFISIDQGATKPPVWKLLNLPVHITEKVPALGTLGDVCLVDPSLYVIGDRMSLEIAASEHVNFLANQMTWRFVQRVDGQPWMDKKVTLQDASSTVSPFVILK